MPVFTQKKKKKILKFQINIDIAMLFQLYFQQHRRVKMLPLIYQYFVNLFFFNLNHSSWKQQLLLFQSQSYIWSLAQFFITLNKF